MVCSWHLCEKARSDGKDFCSHNCRTKFAVTSRRRTLKILAVTYKGGRCLACDYSRYAGALVFHHKDPNEKTITIGSGNTYGWASIKIELRLCILLCKNCHDEVHAGIVDLPTLYDRDLTPEEGEAALLRADLDPNERKRLEDNYCPCGKKITKYAMHCRKCSAPLIARPTKIDWPPSEELARRVAASSRIAVARELGVSDNAVRKRLKNHPPQSDTADRA